MTRLSLSLLGPFQALVNHEPLTHFRTRKVQALLVYLAAGSETSVSRGRLVSLLWPDLPEASARLNLRQILYHLRNAIDVASGHTARDTDTPFILSDRHAIALNPEAEIHVDLHRFSRLIDESFRHDHPDLRGCRPCLGSLERAVTLYRGEFLEDFYLDDSEPFEDWARRIRAALRHQVLDALDALTAALIGQRQLRDARRYAERQIELDNLRESGYRHLMEIFARSGRRSEAMALYERYSRLIDRELGMAPTRATSRMYERIRQGDIDLAEQVTPAVRGYELGDQIGAGAYGVVRRAYQPVIEREVAIKIIASEVASEPEFIRRFEREAQIIASLEHPHIVPIYDYWRDPEGAYLVMRLLRGGTLQQLLSEGPLPYARAIEIVVQVASALAAAHRAGVIHCDVKVANILLDEVGRAYLSDFGIARHLDHESGRRLPDHAQDPTVSARIDVYGLGLVLREMLAGTIAPAEGSAVTHPPGAATGGPSLALAPTGDIPPAIADVIRRATSGRPDVRFESIDAFIEALRAAVTSGPADNWPLLHGERTAGGATIPDAIATPFKGLRAFREVDAPDFFGRDGLVQRLVERLRADSGGIHEAHPAAGRFVAVVGASGSGKSSVIAAGLIPALREGALPGSERWFIVTMTPGPHPLEALATSLLSIAVDPPTSLIEPMRRDTTGLWRTVRRILPSHVDAQLLLVIDQFEELYTLGASAKERQHFIESLLVAIRAPESRLRVVIALRADFFDRPLSFQPLGKLLDTQVDIVLPLTPDELEEAVRGPAERVGVSLEPGLLAAIMADVREQPGVLPLLQYALTELFERRRDGFLTRVAYSELGGVAGALARRAEELFEQLGPTTRETARQIFLRLVTLGEGVEDTRRRALRSELEALAAHPTGDEDDAIRAVLDTFGRARLLTFDHDPRTRRPTVEVAHEALLREWPRLRGWLDMARTDLRLQRRLAIAATEWHESDDDPGFLLRGSRLDQLAGLLSSNHVALNSDEQAFLNTSLAEREARDVAERQRREHELATARRLAQTERDRAEESTRVAKVLRRRATHLAIALGLALVSAAVALYFVGLSAERRIEAEAQTQLATSRELAAAANSNLDSDPELSILLALEALEIAYTREAENALHRAVGASVVEVTFSPASATEYTYRFTPEGTRLVGAGRDGALQLWDVASGEVVWALPPDRRFAAAADDLFVPALAISPDGTRVATAGADGYVTIRDLERSEMVNRIQLDHEAIVQLDYSPDGTRMLAVQSRGMDLTLRDAETLDEISRLAVGEYYTVFAGGGSFSSTGEIFVAGRNDGLVSLHRSATGEEILRLEDLRGQRLPIQSAQISPNDRWLAVKTADGILTVWELNFDAPTPTATHHLDRHGLMRGGSAAAMTFSPDGKSILYLVPGGSVLTLDVETEAERPRITCHPSQTQDIATGARAAHIAAWGGEGHVAICRLAPPYELLVLDHGESELHGLAFSSDGERLYAAGSSLTGWRLEERDRHLAAPQLFSTRATANYLLDVTVSPDTETIITASWAPYPILWDARTGDQLAPQIRSGHSSEIWEVSVSNDGSFVATAGGDGRVVVWHVDSKERVHLLSGHQDVVTNVVFSPDGRLLVSSSRDQTARGWDLSSGTELFSLPHGSAIWGIAIDDQGRFLSTSGADGVVHLWELETLLSGGNRKRWSIPGHAALVTSLAFSPDGGLLASASFDRTTRVWDVETGEERLVLTGHTEAIWDVAFSPDGRWLATASWDGTVRMYVVELDDLIDLAHTRVTRSLTDDECRRYLHRDSCDA